jgi:hypothetical protein
MTESPLYSSTRQNALLTTKLRQALLAQVAYADPDAVDFDPEDDLQSAPSDAYLRRTRNRIENRLRHTLYDFYLLSESPEFYVGAFGDLQVGPDAVQTPLRTGVIGALKTLYQGVGHTDTFEHLLALAVRSATEDFAAEKNVYLNDCDIQVEIGFDDLAPQREAHERGENIPPEAAYQLLVREEIEWSDYLDHCEAAHQEDPSQLSDEEIDVLRDDGRI